MKKYLVFIMLFIGFVSCSQKKEDLKEYIGEITSEEKFENNVFITEEDKFGIANVKGEVIITPASEFLNNLNEYFFLWISHKR